jgi:hypothetical protein
MTESQSEDGLWQTTVQVFTSPGHIARVEVGEGQKLIILLRDKPPVTIGVETAGIYDVAVPDTETYPIAMMSIGHNHVPSWEAKSPSEVNKLLDEFMEIIANNIGEVAGHA